MPSGPTSPSDRPTDHEAPQLDLPPAYPDRAAWGTATSLRAWQSAALTAYFQRRPARLPRGGDARRGQDDVRAHRRRRAARAPGRRADHGGGPHRAPEDPVGGGRGEGGHPARPQLLGASRPHQQRLRRGRADLRRRGGQPARAPDPHRTVQHPGDPRRGAPLRRRALVGRGGAGGLRAGAPTPGADRHAVPLRREPDPVRHLRPRRRRRAALGGGLHLRLRPRVGRPRRAAGAVPGLQRADAVADECR